MNDNVTSRAVRLATVHDPDGGKTTVRLTIEVLGGAAHGLSADALIDTINVMVEGADADAVGAAEEVLDASRTGEAYSAEHDKSRDWFIDRVMAPSVFLFRLAAYGLGFSVAVLLANVWALGGAMPPELPIKPGWMAGALFASGLAIALGGAIADVILERRGHE